jgi:hypothetical protein
MQELQFVLFWLVTSFRFGVQDGDGCISATLFVAYLGARAAMHGLVRPCMYVVAFCWTS